MTTVQTENSFRRSTSRQGWFALLWLTLLCLQMAGCKSPFGLFGRDAADDETTRRMASIDKTQGPLERLLRGKKENAEARSLMPAEGLADLDKARKTLESGQTSKGERALKNVAKKYKDSPVAEDALFDLGESQFERKRYAAAQDSYDQLLEEFPSTQYLDKATQRLFSIAQVWLQDPTVVKTDEIQQVNFDDPSKTPPPADPNPKPRGMTRRVPILPNFWDRSRPVFDTEGRALEALRNIWKKDPTGPLADDALMLEASYHLRHGNYIESDHLFRILREEFPKSPHFENAFVLGSHVKLMSYQGAEYDLQSLEDAEQLKQSASRLFPDNPAHERLQDELHKIQKAKVEQLWSDVTFWKRKGNKKAAAIYCRRIVDEYPNSEFAVRARKMLAELEGPAEKRAAAKAVPAPEPIEPEQYDEPGIERLGPEPSYPQPQPNLTNKNDAGRARL
jgi:TolA-binding protein